MTSTELYNAIMSLNPYQISAITDQVIEYLKLNEELKNTRPDRCPVCDSKTARFIKKGFLRGKQRYECKCCGHKFTYDTMQITSHSHQSVESWISIIQDTFSFSSLDDSAEKIGVCHETAFNMRHKLLSYLEKMTDDGEPLDTIIEADETYVKESKKGIQVTEREPRLHGEKATKRGLSTEQYCICVATDRNNHIVAKCVNRAKPTGNDLIEALGMRIAPDSVILCDGASSYDKLAVHTKCKKVELVGHESYDKVYHLNTVNSLHNRIKEMFRKYRGVASKYLNRYMALFSMMVTYCGCSLIEATDEIRRSLSQCLQYTTYLSTQSEGLLEF